ncbi:carboxylesterase/lipase family protein [Parafilimonas terrae]|uniref:Carboxylic ester hydrolase n=1 Tax=Parafilimonas terrae TaxID=1465490 RepID=A0A1I5YLJ2_9BACT|nr:carboxylesterase family protein [Parafilimonas terrae]SFQ45134.1 para-nitrobenzyl esterase [Parafilimonas terrae]
MNTQRLLAFFFCLFISAISFTQTRTPVVQTQAGSVSGIVQNDINIFKGIPFAAPPVGELRWKAPQPVQPWTGVRNCDTFSASPMQASPAPFSMWSEEFLIRKAPISEDCLYLNVWTSSTSTDKKLPVLVWIYGGGFVSGGSNVPIYDGEAMAKQGIVFVSINYRVGIFGFFAHPELTKEAPYHASGNYGILDQVAALQWVQKNIAAFGGDPGNVTIAGQSAGSMSVNALVASPLAKNLFNKAIAESGASFLRSNSGNSLQQAEEAGEKTATALHVNSIEELRKLPASELMKAQSRSGVIIDGYVLPQSIAAIFQENKANKVDLLTGWNENEGLSGPIKNAGDYIKQMQQQYGDNAQTLLQYYPATNDSIASSSQYDLSRDIIFGAQNYTWANTASGQGNHVYVYRFTHKVPGTGVYAKYGAFHTGEVPYAYNNLKFVNRPWTDIDHKLAGVMSSYWANFIKTANPNGKGLPEWKPYNINEKAIMVLGDTQQSQTMPDAKRLDFLYSIMKPQ